MSSQKIPSLGISPQHALVDEKMTITVHGLEPGAMFTLRASLSDLQGNRWASHSRFRANAEGTLDLAAATPLEGRYDWPDAMGLVCSMQPSDEQQKMVGFIPFGIEPYTIHFLLESPRGDRIEKDVERIWMKAGVKRQVVREDGLFGTLFLPAGKGPHPALILVSGSGGGLSETRAAQYASHGFACLALAYFAYESLSKDLANIPLEYFETAIRFLQAHPEIDPAKLGVTGASRGGELSLLLGATFPQLRAVTAYVPSGLVWAGFGAEITESCASWTWKGNPISWVPDDPSFSDGFAEMIVKGIPIPLTPGFLKSVQHASPQALDAVTIPVEKINGAVLLISGEDDQMWPSTYFSNLVMERLERNSFPHPYQHLSYPGAGHAIMAPYGPLPPSHSLHPVDHQDYAYGGNPKDQAFATEDSWRRVLEFFKTNLAPTSGY